MLADEITADLRAIRGPGAGRRAAHRARASARASSRSKGISYGTIRAIRTAASTLSGVEASIPTCGCGRSSRHGGTISIREFVVGALHNEMGLASRRPADLSRRRAAARVVTPAGMVLDGALDKIEAPPALTTTTDDHDGDGVANEIPTALVDYLEFYLLNYFKPATYRTRPRRRVSRASASSA